MCRLIHSARLAGLAIALLLAGCSVSSTAPVASNATPTARATVPPTPPTPPTPPCGSTPNYADAKRAGDLLLRNEIRFQGLIGWQSRSRKLPDGIPLKPLQVQAFSSKSGLLVPVDPLTNPSMQEGLGDFGGYEIDVCNASATQAHTIQGVTARIDGIAPYSGSLQEWKGSCDGVPYDASHTDLNGGCGGGPYSACEYLHTTFSTTAGAGASVTATQTRSGRDDDGDGRCPQFGPLPISLAAGAAMSINIGMTVPIAAGTYTFAFGVAADGAAPAFVSATPALFAPVAHEWTGSACGTPSMQAQIPAASVPTWYICPQA